MDDADKYRRVEERPLTTEERTLLEWLIVHGGRSASAYSSQLPLVTVVSRCTCGCPTIDLAVAGGPTSGPSSVIADAEGTSPEGIPVGVLLHSREGKLSELEVYSISGFKGRVSLPSPADLVSLNEPNARG